MWWLLGAVRRGVDLVFAHKRPKRAAMFLRSPGRHGYVARMPAQRRRNISPLKTFDNLAFGRLERFSGCGRTRRGGRGESIELDSGPIKNAGPGDFRAEKGRFGKECGRTCNTRWS